MDGRVTSECRLLRVRVELEREELVRICSAPPGSGSLVRFGFSLLAGVVGF